MNDWKKSFACFEQLLRNEKQLINVNNVSSIEMKGGIFGFVEEFEVALNTLSKYMKTQNTYIDDVIERLEQAEKEDYIVNRFAWHKAIKLTEKIKLNEEMKKNEIDDCWKTIKENLQPTLERFYDNMKKNISSYTSK